MPELLIDNQRIEVAEGVKVIEAAERLGIMIPRFCYHKALGSVGACRMCAVNFIEGPLKGIHMSCMVDAQDGMVVSTTDAEAVAFRKYIIECLMLNHPHDCPVCDEGGHCLLQDTTISGGHGSRRYLGQKRTYQDQYLGHVVAHEMNRCIHCYRCVRYYQEFCGYRDFGALQIGSRVFFGRYAEGPLESPFTGNLVDICPTGVFTDKTSRYRVRRWDLERGPSVCIHCSLGCNTIAGARYREVIRHEARLNQDVNGYFICDRGRLGFRYESHIERPRFAQIDGVKTSMQEAMETAAQKIDGAINSLGHHAVACLGSSRNSLETQAMLYRFCHTKKIPEPVFFIDRSLAMKVKSAVSRLDLQLSVSMKDIEHSDFILAVGVDAINEAPMLALAMRQAVRNNAVVVVADPRPLNLPFSFHHFAQRSENLKPFLFAFVKEAIIKPDSTKFHEKFQNFSAAFSREFEMNEYFMDSQDKNRFKVLAEKLGQCKNPVLICGTHVVDETLPDAAADISQLLLRIKGKSGLFYVFPGANSFGASFWDGSNKYCFEQIIENIEKGKTRILMVVENNPIFHFPDQKRFIEAIKKLETFIVIDCLPSPTVNRAGIFIPSTTIFETGGSFINQEGRIQYANPIHRGGIPICQQNKGTHPERAYGLDIPGKGPMASWEILGRISGLITRIGTPDIDFGHLFCSGNDCISVQLKGNYPWDNFLLIPEYSPSGSYSENFDQNLHGPLGDLKILTVDQTFGTEVLSAYSEPTCKLELLPYIDMHPADAAAAEIDEAERVSILLPGGSLEINLIQKSNMARGIIVIPRHRQLPWQKFNSANQWIGFDDITPVR